MKVFISGRITGIDDYKEKFERAARQIEARGHTVLNPAVLPDGMEPKDYMRICLAMIDTADVVFLLPNYWNSPGAQLEVQYCEYTGKDVMFLSNMPWFNLEEWRGGQCGTE